MDVIQEEKNNSGAFIAKDGELIVGEMTYLWAGKDKFVINRTAVISQYQGQGVGKEMVKKAVQYARENQFTILPMCSFARDIFDKNPSYNDVRISN